MSPSEIAVIVPNYQRGNSLLQACETILDQAYPANEVVVVDDGSTNDLNSIRAKLETLGVNWISLRKNCGPAAARNAGVAATISPWITFLDSDDTWMKEKLSSQIAWHEKNPDVRISQVREMWMRDGMAVRKPSQWEPEGGDLFASSVERCSIGPSCVMIHRSLWEETDGFDPRYRVCEDYALWLEISRREQVGKIPGEPLVIKEGGRDDQLSLITPAMDRYRVVALLELLERDQLTPTQRDQAKKELTRKCRILAAGAEKRDRSGRALRYQNIADCIERVSEKVDWRYLIEEAWNEIEQE